MSEHEDQQNYCQFGNMIIPFLQNRDTISPPKAQVDEASLQKAMNKNKESLKVKLMTRRPISQLVDQGILPSLKVTPHFHEQRQKLERAKTTDFLKNKIQRRPDRQELIQQHILEDTTVDPSLHDKQRQLKKARLADDLNDRLSHRPGPLELVKGNILQADEKFVQAVREGQIQFKRTCEGQSLRHPPPSFVVEEDSGGSDVALSPSQNAGDQSLSSLPSVEAFVPSPLNIDSPGSQTDLKPAIISPVSSVPSPVSVPSPPSSHFSSGTASSPLEQVQRDVQCVRVRKKSKPKSQPKPRTIKFHEYKGPPSAQKNLASLSPSETSYELLLKQQQLFLQWQLEWQQKYPQMILPVPPKSSTDQNMSNGHSSRDQVPEVPTVLPPKCWSKLEDLKVSDLKAELKKRNLPVSGSKPQLIERLKPYSDLVNNSSSRKSSSSVQDVTPMVTDSNNMPISVNGIILDTLPSLAVNTKPVASVVTMDTSMNGGPVALPENGSLVVYNTMPMQSQLVVSRPSSVAPMDVEVPSPLAENATDSAVAMNEDIVKQQQKRIEELQRELQRSQLKLQQQQWLQQQQQQQQQQQVHQAPQTLLVSRSVPVAAVNATRLQQVPVTSVVTTLPHQVSNIDTKALQRLQQHLQQKLQQQHLLQQLHQSGSAGAMFQANPSAVSAAVKANLAAFIHNQQQSNARMNTIPAAGATTATINTQALPQVASLQPIVLCQSGAYQANAEKPRANSLPNGFGPPRLVLTSSLPNFSTVVATTPAKPVEAVNIKLNGKLPPDYNEATKQVTKAKQNQKSGSSNSNKRGSKKAVKSEALDDVLEILIKNGELPPSAAQVPTTPNTPEAPRSKVAPAFPSAAPVSQVPPPPPAAPTQPQPSSVPPPPPAPPATTLPSSSTSQSPEVTSSSTNQNSLPSSMLQDNAPDLSLNFDFQLDLNDLEDMDLGGMLDQQNMNLAPQDNCASRDPQIGSDFDGLLQQHRLTEDLQGDKPMEVDMDLSDWLNNMCPPLDNQPGSSTSTSSGYGSDPLLSNMPSNQDMFDMFSLEDMDFKSPPVMNWDKIDFAT